MPTAKAITAKLQVHETEREMAQANVMPTDFSDAGNTRTFTLNYGGNIRYVDGIGWLQWTGRVWKPDKHAVYQIATDFTETMRQDALALYSDTLHKAADAEAKYKDSGDENDKKELEQIKTEAQIAEAYLVHAKRSRERNRIAAIVELASHDRNIVKDISVLDARWTMLNRPDGVTDLRSGVTTFNTENHDSKNLYFTKMTTTKASSDGKEIWMDFLKTITCDDVELEKYLQEIVGMSLYGKVFEEGTYFCTGSGKNGKSTFWNSIQAVLGDYAGTINIDTLTTTTQNNGAELATLRGKRLIVAGEMEEGKTLSASVLKQITSTDVIHCNPKYRDPFDFIPSHTLVVFTNHLPKVKSSDNGTWRRLKIIPFNAVISDKTDVPNYGDYLVENAGPAILQWCVDGATQFWKNGRKLSEPEAVKRATGNYKQREDWLTRFIDKMCVVEVGAQEGLTELYAVYRDWSEMEGEDRLKKREFSNKLMDAGFRRTEHSRVVTFHGIRLDY